MRYFNLFSNILITKGATRILISDLQRGTSELYPLELSEVIEELKNDSIENIFNDYDDESKVIIQEYLDLLLNNEYGFITENDWDHNFPSLSHEYKTASTVQDIFMELEDIEVLRKVKPSVDNFGIRHLVIFSKTKFSIDDLLKIDQLFHGTSLENIEIYSPFNDTINYDQILELNINTSRINHLEFYQCREAPFKPKDNFRFTLNFNHENIKISACGKVDLKYFNTNQSKILEALNHNSCLHKKMGIDINGNIKNCPLMPESFGNIHSSSLEEAFARSGFGKYWNLTKDHIEGCKDCEFRYIRTDCRAYTERSHFDKDNLDISKPLKCGYDPYTGVWEKWTKNPLKQKAMKHYNLENISRLEHT